MSLKIAVQMDPIQRINIKGDSTFALLLEAQKRGHQLAYYTPDRLALLNGRVFAHVESLGVRDKAGDIKHGDKRIILVDGDYAGAVNRIPAPDDLRSNMVRGGAPAATELTKRESEICKRIGPALRKRGLLFVGIDVIDGYLTEINVTSPTGIRAIKNLGGPDLAALIWDKIEQKRRA
jgi:glutathione synthase/RimK-type ligase-like ATP-grasp enzyme